ncbi:hypothetical protein [Paenibacillus sp. LHD-38]|uniref:hypothetical protein n=1 Tax=Paenibacillus sp. LHD-38 TaxID=3072143 RepID=UPI00280F581E|nr:hypothetical protein [Paenibacillus sp. LHD-38]MDQ8735845.1 hypothetical protein [Paenibacillus sp. LHD-38]
MFEEEDDYGYTPKNAIVFLRTGSDGDHFAFLTKGDSVRTLEESPIVFIQPMDLGDRNNHSRFAKKN